MDVEGGHENFCSKGNTMEEGRINMDKDFGPWMIVQKDKKRKEEIRGSYHGKKGRN